MEMIMWIRAIKAARASAGLSQEALAKLIKWSPSTVAAIETGRRVPTTRFAIAADEALQTGGLLTTLLKLADQQRSPIWFTPWRRHEAEALRLRTFQPTLIPGLLQIEEYARAVITAGGLHLPAKAEELIRLRIERQELLTRDNPPECVFIIDEAALPRPIGDHRTLDLQLQRLQELAKLPNVRIHVIPIAVGAHVGLTGGFALADLPESDHVIYLENVARGQVADDPETVRFLKRKWDILLGDALSPSASLNVIAKYRLTP